MGGETNLDVLLATMTPRLSPEVFVFVTCPDRTWPEGLDPVCFFQEPQGTTLILHRAEAEQAGLHATFPCRMITLEIHSALEAVGFIATISTALARADMGVNPVAGFFHDHLFVPDGRQNDALDVLEDISRAAQTRLQARAADE